MTPEQKIANSANELLSALLDSEWDSVSATRAVIIAIPEITKHYLKGQ